MSSFLSIKSDGPSPYFKKSSLKNQGTLLRSMERLATGVRVNHAKDDVAAMGINNRLTAQLKGARAAIRNISDGASLLQTIESALGESTVALLRARELATQAANDHLGVLDLEAIKAEFNELVTHVNKISEQTTFNGIKVLDGEHHEDISLQVSELSGETVKLGPLKVNTESLGRQARYTSKRRGAFIGDLKAGEMMINGVAIRATTESDDELSYSYASGSALAKAAAINQASPHTGVRAIAGPTIIEGFEPIRKMTLDEEHYFKINGHAISGFTFEDKDATGSLVKNINAAYEDTQVRAQMTSDGRVNLIAEDGRNITVEYGTAEVRDAMRIIDSFGDPINLAGTVDPVITNLDGDISEVTFSAAPGGSGLTFSPIADALRNDETDLDAVVIPTDKGGISDRGDHADFVLEVVDEGQFGTATFRLKSEPVPTGLADVQGGSESYHWAVRGAYNDFGESRISQASDSYYNEASNRLYTLTVTDGGNPASTNPANHPSFTYTIFNKDTGVYELDSDGDTTFNPTPAKVSVGTSTVELAHGVKLDVAGTTTYATGPSSSAVSPGGYLLKSTGAQNYTLNPQFLSWDGSTKTDYKIEVLESGHYASGTSQPNSGDSSKTQRAKIKITSNLNPTGQTYTLSDQPTQTINFDGLELRFTSQSKSPSSISSSSAAGTTYEKSKMNLSKSVYTAQSNLTYKVTVNETGRLTSGGAGLNATLTVDGNSFGMTLKAGDNIIGDGTAFDHGLILSAGASSTSRSVVRSAGDYGGTASVSGTYNGTTNDQIFIRVAQAGGIGDALFEYSLASDPGNWSSPDTLDNIKNNIDGTGVSFNLTEDTSQNLEVGDQWTITLDADVIMAGTTYSFTGNSANLTKGVTWDLTATPPEWVKDEVIKIDMSHNYEDNLYTLTDTISLADVGDFKINGGAGRTFKTGEEIRVHTRSFTGSATSGGTYGDNLYPTYYKLVITEPGEIGTAKFVWSRLDERQDLTQNPQLFGYGPNPTDGFTQYTTSSSPITLESGVEISWSDTSASSVNLFHGGLFTGFPSTSSYLSVGDTFLIPVGQKLEYTFGGQLTLVSEENIHIEYSDVNVDNQMGRFLFVGDEEDNNTAGTETTLTSGILGVNETKSIDDLLLDDRFLAGEAIDTLGLAVDQLSGMRTVIGALINSLESASRSTSERALNLSAASARLVDADMATEAAELTRAQILTSLTPQLAQTERLSAMKTLDLLRLNSIG